ncbi:PAS domain S-box protein [Candidatus Sumerlaeota bacterium]|nr:PAS domain S-box protein [Candidatus Sumerlaeota bacterium]
MKIRTKLILSFLPFAFLIGVVGFYATEISRQILEDTIRKDAQSLAMETMNELNNLISLQLENYGAYTLSGSIQETLEQSNLEFQALPDIEAHIDRIDAQWTDPSSESMRIVKSLQENDLAEDFRRNMDHYKKSYGYDIIVEMFLTNKYGANVVQTGKPSDFRQNDEDWWRQAHDNRFFIGDVEYDESAGFYSLCLAVRVDDLSGEFIGVLKAVVNIEYVIHPLKELQKIEFDVNNRRREFHLETNDGRWIYATHPFIFMQRRADSHYNQDGSVAHKTDNNMLMVQTAANDGGVLSSLGWKLVIEEPKSDAFAASNRLSRDILLVTAIMTLVSMFVAWGVSLTISRPLHELQQGAKKIAAGDINYKVATKAKDEIGSLSRVFDYMTNEIRESEQKSKHILEHFNLGVALFAPDMRILETNTKMRELFPGLNVDQQQQLICYHALHGLDQEEPCADCPVVWTFQDSKTHETVKEVQADDEIRHYRIASAPILDSENQAVSSIMMVEDVTDRVKRDRSLMRLATAVDQAKETIVVTDLSGDIQYANPAFEKITGYTLDEAIGQNPRILKSGKHDDSFYAELWDTISSGRVWSGEFINKKKDGSLYSEYATISPITNDAGAIEGYVAVKRDITQENQLKAELQQAQKLESIGQLAAGIAHEINTPTQFIGDNTRFLNDGFRDIEKILDKYNELKEAAKKDGVPRDLIEELEAIIEDCDLEFLKEEIPTAIERSLVGIERVTKIVRAMKDFSHPGSDEATLTDINKAIDSTVTVARNEWKYVADLETDFEEKLPLTPCFPGPFNQVILNMIINASHAIAEKNSGESAEKGKIIISTRSDNDWVEIRIADTGAGIAEANLGKIFDHFFTTKPVGKGTGQGLAIAYATIVEQHKGTIDVESKVGEGTTFIIRLPLKQ